MAFICLENCIYPIRRKKNINNKNENKLGVLKGSWGTVSVGTGTKYCFKGASNIACRMCLFSNWYLVSERESFGVCYYKIKCIDKELCARSGSGYRCELAVPPLTAAEQDFGSSVALRASYKHCSGLGEIPAENELFFACHTTACQCCSQSWDFSTPVLPSTSETCTSISCCSKEPGKTSGLCRKGSRSDLWCLVRAVPFQGRAAGDSCRGVERGNKSKWCLE